MNLHPKHKVFFLVITREQGLHFHDFYIIYFNIRWQKLHLKDDFCWKTSLLPEDKLLSAKSTEIQRVMDHRLLLLFPISCKCSVAIHLFKDTLLEAFFFSWSTTRRHFYAKCFAILKWPNFMQVYLCYNMWQDLMEPLSIIERNWLEAFMYRAKQNMF